MQRASRQRQRLFQKTPRTLRVLRPATSSHPIKIHTTFASVAWFELPVSHSRQAAECSLGLLIVGKGRIRSWAVDHFHTPFVDLRQEGDRNLEVLDLASESLETLIGGREDLLRYCASTGISA